VVWVKKRVPAHPGERSAVRFPIREWIMEIIGLLEGENFVHGDLRVTNIMIKKDGSAPKVIDLTHLGWRGKLVIRLAGMRILRSGLWGLNWGD